MTFYSWIKQFKNDWSAIGDIAGDIVEDMRDGCLPKNASVKEIHEHVEYDHHACDEAIEALDKAIERYKMEIKT